MIASSANGLEVYFRQDKNLLDIGGIANTIFEVVTGVKFKKKVKREFIFGTYDRALAALWVVLLVRITFEFFKFCAYHILNQIPGYGSDSDFSAERNGRFLEQND